MSSDLVLHLCFCRFDLVLPTKEQTWLSGKILHYQYQRGNVKKEDQAQQEAYDEDDIHENLDSVAEFEVPSSPDFNYFQTFPGDEDYAEEDGHFSMLLLLV
ncbi:hypothetical protein AgCh_020551 [Apium graveolens]